ncbi:triple tyrosine motif-containing protein [Gaoshiqia sp. Z1-71]|uniref:triple tyrosine motif-containing protein n=1 Tax=Gaoshiqia hydrogeniformans TaxID=3290090 RepID=UPI003BF90B2F
MRHTNRNILLIILLCLYSLSFGQLKDIGIPDIQNFTKREYQASAQNWQIEKDSRNFMYFANNDGLLEFDGAHWQLYGLPNRSIVRSVKIDENGRIYVGQQNDFGYMEPDSAGRLQYHSLLKLVSPGERNFEEVWRIHLTHFGVVFQSYTHLFIYRNNNIYQVPLKHRLKFSFFENGRLWVQDEEEGLKEYRQGRFFKPEGLDSLIDKDVWAILPVNSNRLLICTATKGVYSYDGQQLIPWQGEANEFLSENQIFSAKKFKDTYYAFGTIQNGLMITDETGKIIQHVNKKKGLQNNTILSIGTDQDENLWLGLDNGIDYIDVSSPFTYLFHPEGLGASYSSLVHNGRLYVGTNHGLFVKEWPEKARIEIEGFRLIPKTVGQIWYLGVQQDVLLCGHDNGTFVIEEETATQISDINGAWTFIEPIQNSNYLIGGNYSGLTLFKKTPDNKSWELRGQIKGFSESSKLLAQDKKGQLWMSHGFKGIFRINLDQQLDSVTEYAFYNSKNGLPSDIFINLMTVGGNIIFTSPAGIYAYSENTDQFERSAYYNNIFGHQPDIDYLKEDQYLNIWFIAGGVPGVLRFQEDGTYTRVKAPFEKLAGRIISGFQHIHIADQQNTFISLEDGLAHYTPSYQLITDASFKTYIREVVNLQNNEILFPNSIPARPVGTLPEYEYKGNNLKFTYSSPDYKNNKKISYSYLLENYSTGWSAWSAESSCEFMNLREGYYTFRVKATGPFTNESNTDSFSFYIRPPWYRSALAYSGYTLLAVAFIGLIIWFVLYRIRISRRKERLKHLQEYRKKVQQYQRDALISEKEIIKLRNEQLRGKMIHLDKELANQTMTVIHKNKFMGKLKSELKNLQGQVSDSNIKSRISLIMNRIDKEFDDKRQNELFETYFDEVHEDFFKRLAEKHPSLTPREQKLCAYIKMNISSKEIAALLNISQRGVEISRYRLRKKLNLPQETNLGAFISNI